MSHVANRTSQEKTAGRQTGERGLLAYKSHFSACGTNCWLAKAIFQPAGRIVSLQKPFFSLRERIVGLQKPFFSLG
ncbi:MAG: hypothetical protein LBI89_03265, partial [Prevotellaceae bacterium]|nr:hypothetical protein [Prevotellaceae bacterium]